MRQPSPPGTSGRSESPGLSDLVHLPAILEGLARNPALPEEIALRLLPYGGALLRLTCREGITPSADLCEALLARGEGEALAHAASLPPVVADRLAADPDPRVRATRARVEGAGAGRQALFAADAEADVRIALAGHADLAAHDDAAERGSAVLLCGPSASGRDARARDLARRGYLRLSLEEDVRDRLGREPVERGTDEHDRLRAKVQRELWCELDQVLVDREPVVVDHGVLNGTAAAHHRALFKSHGYRCDIVHVEADAAPQG